MLNVNSFIPAATKTATETNTHTNTDGIHPQNSKAHQLERPVSLEANVVGLEVSVDDKHFGHVVMQVLQRQG